MPQENDLDSFDRDILQDKKHISLDLIRKSWLELRKDILSRKKRELINLYVHVPFCYRRCNGCPYYSIPVDKLDLDAFTYVKDRYLDYIRKLLDYFAPFFKGLTVTNLYVGGGTPSMLDTHEIDRLLRTIFKCVSFHDSGERCFECNPHSMNLEKTRLIKSYGFNRLSFGVQSTGKKILISHNRSYQDDLDIIRLLDSARKSGMPTTNADLLFGLEGQDEEDVVQGLAFLMDQCISEITLYRFEHPAMKDNSLIEKINSFSIRLYPLLARLADKKGYILQTKEKMPHCFSFAKKQFGAGISKKDSELYRYTDLPIYPFSIFGIGPNIRCTVDSNLSYEFFKPDKPEGILDFYTFDEKKNVASGTYINDKTALLKKMTYLMRRSKDICIDTIHKDYNILLKKENLEFMLEQRYILIDEGMLRISSSSYEERLLFLHGFASIMKMKPISNQFKPE